MDTWMIVFPVNLHQRNHNTGSHCALAQQKLPLLPTSRRYHINTFSVQTQITYLLTLAFSGAVEFNGSSFSELMHDVSDYYYTSHENIAYCVTDGARGREKYFRGAGAELGTGVFITGTSREVWWLCVG